MIYQTIKSESSVDVTDDRCERQEKEYHANGRRRSNPLDKTMKMKMNEQWI